MSVLLRNQFIKALFLFCVLFQQACRVDPTDISQDSTAAEIIKLAEEALASEEYGRAGDFFLQLSKIYPYTDQARASLIRGAKAYHAGSDLLNSRIAAKSYLTLYPRTKESAFAKYLIGLTYYEAIIDVNRDQGAATDALREFEELISDYPDSPYADLAKQKFDKAEAQLAGQEMSVGRFYLNREKHLAAINRFETVVKLYPSSPYMVEALYRLVEANISLGILDKAEKNLNLLKRKFPDSVWTLDAEKMISKLIQG